MTKLTYVRFEPKPHHKPLTGMKLHIAAPRKIVRAEDSPRERGEYVKSIAESGCRARLYCAGRGARLLPKCGRSRFSDN
jgi:hypothetical protein